MRHRHFRGWRELEWVIFACNDHGDIGTHFTLDQRSGEQQVKRTLRRFTQQLAEHVHQLGRQAPGHFQLGYSGTSEKGGQQFVLRSRIGWGGRQVMSCRGGSRWHRPRSRGGGGPRGFGRGPPPAGGGAGPAPPGGGGTRGFGRGLRPRGGTPRRRSLRRLLRGTIRRSRRVTLWHVAAWSIHSQRIRACRRRRVGAEKRQRVYGASRRTWLLLVERHAVSFARRPDDHGADFSRITPRVGRLPGKHHIVGGRRDLLRSWGWGVGPYLGHAERALQFRRVIPLAM